uniref:Myb/SANT-like DNA-binding domain-containing protein n=1 Tax=Anopheles christyi TaxID=43041 RepID=A0A182K4C7_9DIPT
MNKRNIWKYEETKEMLQIMQDNSYAGSFSSKHKQNMEIFRKIENKMIESGYPYKNYMQIGVRWKNLKNLYTKAKRSNSKNEQQLFPFYEEMDNLLKRFYKSETVSSEGNVGALDSGEVMGDTKNTSSVAESSSGEHDRTFADIKPARNVERSGVTIGRAYGRLTSGQKKAARKSALHTTIAMSKQELSDEFYRSQKRLIDYEFSLYVRKEQELIDRIQETTRTMMEENMNNFFTRLKDVLACQSVQQVEVIETYE